VRLLRDLDFDVVQVCNPPDIFFLHGLLYKRIGKAFIFDQHDLAPELFSARYGGRHPLLLRAVYLAEWLSYKVADAVVVTNNSIRDIASRRGADPRRTFVVRNGPAGQRLERVPPEPELKRGRPHLVVFEGLMGPQDGVDLAVRAASWIIQEAGRTDISFAFLGDGEELPALKGLVQEFGIGDYVEFTGFVRGDTLMRYLCTADVGIVPDPKNGVNELSTLVKVNEYMASETAIVAFDLKETRFSAQDAAVYAEPNDYRGLARLVIELVDDPERRRRMGQLGRKRVEEILAWDHQKGQLLAAYEMALARRARR
jgi:glycosyltransferase involved in cell wall biosynthesis